MGMKVQEQDFDHWVSLQSKYVLKGFGMMSVRGQSMAIDGATLEFPFD
jgi:hypothetical protein